MGVRILLLCALLLSGKSEALSCSQSFKSIVAFGTKALIRAVVVVSLPATAMEIVGKANETPHIGLSIYLDMEGIRGRLNEADQKVFDRPLSDPIKFAERLSLALSKKYVMGESSLAFFNPHMASEYFGRESPSPNICRHKAVILASILNAKGIRAELQTGELTSESGEVVDHAWVYLRDYDLIADPTVGSLESRYAYLKAEGFRGYTEYWRFYYVGGAYSQ